MNSEKKINFQLSGENTYESFLWGHQTLVLAKPDENIMIKTNYDQSNTSGYRLNNYQ